MARPIPPPFQISAEDIARSSTLEASDLGRWALLITGCFQTFEDEEAANRTRKTLSSNQEA